MSANELAINIDDCLIIDSTKIKHNVLASPVCRNINAALIPKARNEVCVLNTRKTTFGAERNSYLTIKALTVAPSLICTCLTKVEAVTPSTVKVYPFCTFKLRTRILITRDVHRFHCTAQSEQKRCCYEHLVEVFHHNFFWLIN